MRIIEIKSLYFLKNNSEWLCFFFLRLFDVILVLIRLFSSFFKWVIHEGDKIQRFIYFYDFIYSFELEHWGDYREGERQKEREKTAC